MLRAKHSATGGPAVLSPAEIRAVLVLMLETAWVEERGGEHELGVLRRAIHKLGSHLAGQVVRERHHEHGLALAVDEVEALFHRIQRIRFAAGDELPSELLEAESKLADVLGVTTRQGPARADQ